MNSSNKQKICLVIPSLHTGGMERVMSEFINYLDEKDSLEIHLVLYGIKRDVFYKIPNRINTHRPAFKFNNKFRLYFTLKTIWFLRKKINIIQPDTVLSFGEVWNNFVLLALYGTPFPVFISDRCQPNKKLGGYHEILRNWLYPSAKGIIVQTNKAFKVYKEKFHHRNFKVIGNPIKHFKAKGYKERENIVLSVGRLIKSKHHDRLIKIFAKLNRPNWKLVIVGGDALKQKNMSTLKSLIQQLQMTDKIELTGSIQDVASYYFKSKIFAFTSSSEGFPNVIGEALAAELPVITYDCIAGPSDMIIDGHNGHLIELFDDDAFSEKLAKLMDNEGYRKRLAINAKESIKKFEPQSICENFYQFITN